MKNKFFLGLFILSALFTSAKDNSSIKSPRKHEVIPYWTIGQAVQANGVIITREAGESQNNRTNVHYTPLAEIICRGEEMLAAKSIANEGKEQLLRKYEDASPGGQLALLLERDSKSEANAGKFVVTISDTEGEVIFTRLLPAVSAIYAGQGRWINKIYINIPYYLNEKFLIKITDYGKSEVHVFSVQKRVIDEELIVAQTAAI